MPREKIATWPSALASRVTVRPCEALSGNRTITAAELEAWQAFVFDPSTTSRDVLLPPVAACQGVNIVICNLGTTTGTLVVKDSGGTAIVTIPATAAGKRTGAHLFCDGSAWFGLYGSVA